MLRTIIFFGTYIPFTGFCIVLAVIASIISGANLAHALATLWGKVALLLGGVEIDVEGNEHIPLDRPAIFMANHQSNFDVPILYTQLPIQFRWLAKKELFDVPFFGFAMKRAGYIPVDRTDRRKAIKSMGDAADRIRQGASVIIFPEGTRSPDGNLLPFKKGGFMLALESGAPIVPVAISGSRDLMPKQKLRIQGGTVKLRFFPPIETGNLSVENRDQMMNEVRNAIDSVVSPGKDKHDD
jgi:1-acyl-sn-glycerol-3-phosphate acyltransferase